MTTSFVPAPSPEAGPPPRQMRAVPFTLGLLGLGVVVALLAGGLSGAARPLDLGDPGPVVRWGLLAAKVVTDLAAAATFGTGLLMCAALSPARRASWDQGLRVLSGSAGLWAIGASVVLVLSGADIAGLPLNHHGFGPALSEFATTVETGRLALLALAFASGTAIVAGAVRGLTGVAWASVCAAIAFIPTGLAGHAAGPGHEIVASAWWLHALGTGAWVGGLFTLLVLARALGDRLAVTTARYSEVAGWGYALVLFSGVAGALPRLGAASALWSSYGALLVAKTVLLVLLGVAGWRQRQAAVPRLAAAEPGAFLRLARGEVVLMVAAFGLAAALSRTPPPVSQELPADPTPAEVVTGVPLPPPLTVGRLFTEFTADVLWIAIAAALLTGYLGLVLRLRRRGDRWPLGRAICWVIGCLLLVYVTCGGIAVYGRTLFSVHMVAHMALSMMVPPFLVFAAPVTLALRGFTARHDGSRGPREWLRAVLDARYFAFVAHPVVAAMIFTFSLIVFYFSPLFGLALRTHLGHELMMVHFLLAGYLFVFAVVGVDPSPVRVAYPLRLLLLFITMAFHAFFSVSLMSMSTVLQATYFSSVGWGIDLLADQADGGSVAWAVGDGPTLLLGIILAIQWARSDERTARQHDRAADRDNDAELNAYNEMLASLRQRDDAR